MEKELVIFDKDGTLMDFDAFWVGVSEKAVKAVLENVGMNELGISEFLTAFGVEGGVTDIDGILCKGTYKQLGTAVYEILAQHGFCGSADEVVQMLIDAYDDNSEDGIVIPTCENLAEVLGKLKNSGKRLVVVTTDNYEITYKCLERLGVRGLFDEVFADDGISPTKPNPEVILNYMAKHNIPKEKAVMVGDTMTDMLFAKNAGISSIGVGKSAKNREKLSPHAAAVAKDVSCVFEIIEEM